MFPEKDPQAMPKERAGIEFEGRQEEISSLHIEMQSAIISAPSSAEFALAAFSKEVSNIERKKGTTKTVVRDASIEDIGRLAEIDLLMFENAYGSGKPEVESVEEMLTHRLENVMGSNGAMIVCEVDGVIEGFATYFKTGKLWDDFKTWEDMTNEGTLDEVVDPESRYAYVANMTVTPKGSEQRAMQKIMARMFAEAIREDIIYGFFVSRIPQFTQWLNERGVDFKETAEEELDSLAHTYITETRVSPKNTEKVEPYDYELRTYQRAGFEMGKLVKGGFSDEESLNYGVTFKVPVPLAGKPKPIRHIAARALSAVSRSTTLASKLF